MTHGTIDRAVDFGAQALEQKIQSPSASFHELWEIAIVLEPLAAQLAAGHATDQDLDELEKIVCATEALLSEGPARPEQFEELIALDISFHSKIAHASGNRALTIARTSVNLLYCPAMSELQVRLPQAHTRNCSAHRYIFNELRRQDSKRAEHWMRKHLIDYQRGYVLARLDMDVDIQLNGEMSGKMKS